MIVGRVASTLIRRTTLSQSLTAIRRGGHGPEGPGSTLPFQIANKPRLLLVMTTFIATGYGIPYFMLWNAQRSMRSSDYEGGRI